MPERPLTLKGGTLIDGTGRPPVDNAVIVIEGARFKAVGAKDQIAIPPDSEIVDLSGRHVLPGFIDGHAHLEDFHGELCLHLGITTCATIEFFKMAPGHWPKRPGRRSARSAVRASGHRGAQSVGTEARPTRRVRARFAAT